MAIPSHSRGQSVPRGVKNFTDFSIQEDSKLDEELLKLNSRQRVLKRLVENQYKNAFSAKQKVDAKRKGSFVPEI